MQLHHIQVVRQLLLERRVLRDAREGAGRAERRALLKRKVLLEVERGDLPEARDEGVALASGDLRRVGTGAALEIALPGGVVPDVLEAVEGLGDGGEVGEEVGSGEIGGGAGGEGGEVRDGDGGGGGPPADPGGIGGPGEGGVGEGSGGGGEGGGGGSPGEVGRRRPSRRRGRLRIHGSGKRGRG